MDEQDAHALRAMMEHAPPPGQEPVSEERHVTVVDLEAQHRALRRERERLAADAEWLE